MKRNARQLLTLASLVALCASLSLSAPVASFAQSNDLSSPTPVYNSEIAGRIAPLDVGDPRQTRHFYIFNARPGDLELNVEANNLDGEIDLFTVAAMRPLAQVTLYSGLGSNVTRTIFFRRDESVILRVQARSPNDSEGTYRIRLGGTFAPSTLPPPDESARNNGGTPASSSAKTAEKGTRRVNSIGARIEEPKVETPAAPAASERAETPGETTTTSKPATNAKTAPARGATASRTPTARRSATRRAAPTRTTTPTTEGAKTEPGKTATTETKPTSSETAREEPTRDETARKEPARTAANANRTRANRTRGSRTNAAGSEGTPAAKGSSSSSSETAAPASPSNSAAPAAATGLEAPGSRIVLELRDGTRIVREMSEVRRVAVEGRLVVIVLKNGRVERQPLANVQRMSIEP
jgi:DNA-binding protein HU-beta